MAAPLHETEPRAIDELVRDLHRPEWPYTKCVECRHDLEEHNEDGRCHEPGCTCGLNRWGA